MRVRSDDGSGGARVWLDRSEVDFLLDNADFGEQSGFVDVGGGQTVFVDDAEDLRRFALGLGVRCGLRAEEVVSVTSEDVVEADAGQRIRVDGDAGDRLTPIPSWMASSVDRYSTGADAPEDSPILEVGIDTIENWIREAAERCRIQSEEDGWRHVDSRDLRRTWARLLVDSGVDPALVLEWGGWTDWRSFRETCYGSCPPEVERTEAKKAPWMDEEQSGSAVSTRKVSSRAAEDLDVRQ